MNSELERLYETAISIKSDGGDILDVLAVVADELPEIKTIAELNEAIENCTIE